MGFSNHENFGLVVGTFLLCNIENSEEENYNLTSKNTRLILNTVTKKAHFPTENQDVPSRNVWAHCWGKSFIVCTIFLTLRNTFQYVM